MTAIDAVLTVGRPLARAELRAGSRLLQVGAEALERLGTLEAAGARTALHGAAVERLTRGAEYVRALGNSGSKDYWARVADDILAQVGRTSADNPGSPHAGAAVGAAFDGAAALLKRALHTAA